MLTQEKIVEILRNELPYLASRYGVKKVGLFGSFAKGTSKEGSDIDLVVEFDKPIGFGFLELADYVEELLGRRLDIITAEGLKSIRVSNVAKDIERSVIYV